MLYCFPDEGGRLKLMSTFIHETKLGKVLVLVQDGTGISNSTNRTEEREMEQWISIIF